MYCRGWGNLGVCGLGQVVYLGMEGMVGKRTTGHVGGHTSGRVGHIGVDVLGVGGMVTRGG